MPVHSEWVRYGDQRGFFAYPAKAAQPLPSILVIQEIWGVNDQIQDLTRRLAAAGYAALAPDLFCQDGERLAYFSEQRIEQAFQFSLSVPAAAWTDPAAREIEMAKLPELKRSEIQETFAKIFSVPGRLPALVPALRQAAKYLRHDSALSQGQKMGCVGFCMGGGLSALLACEEPDLDAAAIYYGSAPAIEKIPQIHCPIIGFYGGNDLRVNAGLPDFQAGMTAAQKSLEVHIYPQANHGFFNETGRAYDVAASRDSFVRLLSFFQKNLVT